MCERSKLVYKSNTSGYLFIDAENIKLDFDLIDKDIYGYFSEITGIEMDNWVFITYHSIETGPSERLDHIASKHRHFHHFVIKKKKDHEVVDTALFLDVMTIAAKAQAQVHTIKPKVYVMSNDDDYYELIGSLVFIGVTAKLITNNDIMLKCWYANNSFEYILIKPINMMYRTPESKRSLDKFWIKQYIAKHNKRLLGVTTSSLIDQISPSMLRPEEMDTDMLAMKCEDAHIEEVDDESLESLESFVDAVSEEIDIVSPTKSDPTPIVGDTSTITSSRLSDLRAGAQSYKPRNICSSVVKAMSCVEPTIDHPPERWKPYKPVAINLTCHDLSVFEWRDKLEKYTRIIKSTMAYHSNSMERIEVYSYAQLAEVIRQNAAIVGGRNAVRSAMTRVIQFLVQNRIIDMVNLENHPDFRDYKRAVSVVVSNRDSLTGNSLSFKLV